LKSSLRRCSCGGDAITYWTRSNGHQIWCRICRKETRFHPTYDSAVAEWERINEEKVSRTAG